MLDLMRYAYGWMPDVGILYSWLPEKMERMKKEYPPSIYGGIEALRWQMEFYGKNSH